jgi:hypothetical protein
MVSMVFFFPGACTKTPEGTPERIVYIEQVWLISQSSSLCSKQKTQLEKCCTTHFLTNNGEKGSA